MHSVRVTSLSITCTVLALLMLLLCSITEKMYVFTIDVDVTAQGPNSDAAATAAAVAQREAGYVRTLRLASDYSQSLRDAAAVSASTDADVAAVTAESSAAASLSDSQGASIHTEWGIGLFSFCFDFRLSASNGNVTVFALNIAKNCQIIRTSDCSVSFLPVFESIAAMHGASLPSDVAAQADDVLLIDQCGQYITARAFVVLAMLAALLGGAAHLLRWRRKIPLGGVVGALAVLTVCCVIGVALVTALEQNDTRLTFINTFALVAPDATQGLEFGAAFFLLVSGLTLAVLALGAVGFQAIQGAERGDSRMSMELGAGQLQDSRNIGLLHVEQGQGMQYRQMQM